MGSFSNNNPMQSSGLCVTANDDRLAQAERKTNAGKPPLRRKDQVRQAMSITGSERPGALPNAWRGRRIRCAIRQSKRLQARQIHKENQGDVAGHPSIEAGASTLGHAAAWP